MTLEVTSAYITRVGSDHTIVLPDEMPIGATVAVVVVQPRTTPLDDAERHIRFAETLSAIRAASAHEAARPTISDSDLDRLIGKARKTSQA